jgi:hypothetical protein
MCGESRLISRMREVALAAREQRRKWQSLTVQYSGRRIEGGWFVVVGRNVGL